MAFFYDILILTFGVCDNYGILPFYHTHLLLPIEILEQGLGQKGMLVEKKAVPWVDNRAVSWFLFDIVKESTEN